MPSARANGVPAPASTWAAPTMPHMSKAYDRRSPADEWWLGVQAIPIRPGRVRPCTNPSVRLPSQPPYVRAVVLEECLLLAIEVTRADAWRDPPLVEQARAHVRNHQQLLGV